MWTDAKIFRGVASFASIVGILTIFYDFYISNEFGIERSFLVSITILLLFNLVRLNNNKMYSNNIIAYIANVLILIFAIFICYILFLLLFGYGFLGGDIPGVWYISSICNLIILLIAGSEIVRKL